jgi:hypothetical protein
MARLEFFVVSKSISIDQSTNQTSIFEILEEVHASAFPVFIPSCVAMSLWRREQGDQEQDFQLLLRITTPTHAVHEVRTNFRLGSPRHRVTQRIEGLPLEGEGKLRFEAILNGEHAAEHLVDIHRGARVDSVASPAKPAAPEPAKETEN